MSETTPPTSGYHADYLQPGMRVWYKRQQLNDKGKLVEMVFGTAGDLTYQGYTTIANATYLIFDRVAGAGRKAKTEQYAVNAFHLPHIGPYRP